MEGGDILSRPSKSGNLGSPLGFCSFAGVLAGEVTVFPVMFCWRRVVIVKKFFVFYKYLSQFPYKSPLIYIYNIYMYTYIYTLLVLFVCRILTNT